MKVCRSSCTSILLFLCLFYRVDPYGFERPDDFDYASYEAFFSRYLVVLTRRAIKWSKLLKGKNSIQKSLKGELYVYLKVKEHCVGTGIYHIQFMWVFEC